MPENNLPAVRESQETALVVPPDVKLEQGKAAAKALKAMIDSTGSKIKIGTSEHIKAEAWQTVGTFFHVTAKTEVEPCDVEGIKGAKAKAYVMDDVTGNQVGYAEAYCMRDERNWANRSWAQIAAMAQTRAASRALANKFKWITVLAGFSPTPAEELEGETHHASPPRGAAAVDDALEPRIPLLLAQQITDITDMLAKLNGGDAELMDSHLMQLTAYKAKATGEEKSLKVADLPSVAKNRPAWIKNIQEKVFKEYQKAFDAEGKPI